jgi:hypothetical protein
MFSWAIISTKRKMQEKLLDDEYAKIEQIREEARERSEDLFGQKVWHRMVK